MTVRWLPGAINTDDRDRPIGWGGQSGLRVMHLITVTSDTLDCPSVIGNSKSLSDRWSVPTGL